VLIEQALQQEQQIAALQKELAAQSQLITAHDQLIAAVKVDTDKRFSDLADFDTKAELTVLFDINSTNLNDKAKEELKAIAEKAKTYKGYLVQVAGFADSTGSASANQNLSDRRAEAVANFLRQSGDLGMSRVLAPVAMSTSKPVAPNETAQGKAENRRVTVKVVVNRGISQ
jgi:OmpA-OmpF porin, OOP family